MAKILLSGFILVAAEDLQAVRDALHAHIELTRQEPGCCSFSVTECPQQPGRFEVRESFVNRAAFDAHQLRVKHSHWGQVSRHVERFYQITELPSC